MTSNKPDARSIFLQAAEIQDLEERNRFLDEACGADSELRLRVEELLDSFDEAGSSIENKPIAAFQETNIVPSVTEKPGDAIGPYKPLQQIGEGEFRRC